jgi:hypothetical protein
MKPTADCPSAAVLRERQRKRDLYHNNPEYRARVIERSLGRDRVPDDAPEHCRGKPYSYYRYHTDPAYRALVCERQRRYSEAKRAAAPPPAVPVHRAVVPADAPAQFQGRSYRYWRYHNDEAFREGACARQRAYNARCEADEERREQRRAYQRAYYARKKAEREQAKASSREGHPRLADAHLERELAREQEGLRPNQADAA